MKKFIYLSIALLSLSVISCREQDEMAQLLNEQPSNTLSAKASNTNPTEYANFNAANSVDGDPTNPPQD